MSDAPKTPTSPIGSSEPINNTIAVRNVCICGLALVAVFALLHWLSSPFEYGSQLTRPYFAVSGLLLVASVISFFGLTNALKVAKQQSRTLLLLIASFALCARLITVFTCPILEIDYYRYLWDGKVVAAGVSPYLHSPEQVLNARSDDVETLSKVNALALRSESNYTILSRIHFEDHTTIYPPVSQIVFGAVMSWVPESVSVEAHIVAMKLALVLFDFGTLVLVYFLLRKLDINIGWLIVYAWNPLVIKEIANGGHLDSIATFFMIASIVLLSRWQLSGSGKAKGWYLAGSGIALGLGFGAKLFPIILLPALTVHVARKSWIQASWFALLFASVTILALWPMLTPILNSEPAAGVQMSNHDNEPADNQSDVVQDVSHKEPLVTAAKHGAVGFFSKWRMNDTVFSFVYLNFKVSDRDLNKTPWYVFTSTDFRKRFDDWCQGNSFGGGSPAFFTAKVLTTGIFLIFYGWQLVAIWRRKFEDRGTGPEDFAFLSNRLTMILTVFLFLQPTVNPWYFVWLMPLACVSRNRGWLLVSGLLMAYYSRFWFKSLDGSFEIFWRKYTGVGVYDHFVVWIVTPVVFATLLLYASSKFEDQPDGRAQDKSLDIL